MKFKNTHKDHQVTDESIYKSRRKLIKAGLIGGASVLSGSSMALTLPKHKTNPSFVIDELTEERDATTYNNFYEFGLSKSAPAENAGSMKTEPWTVEIGGLCEKQGPVDLEKLISNFQIEERVYRMRCVEAWSMVIPWMGFKLADLVKYCQPTSDAKYVYFETLYDPQQMPGQKGRSIPWPYREGLRMDEAMNELTLMTVGMYGKKLPNQNGAPLRLIVPWKYGFKGIKSIVKIKFLDKQPVNSWQAIAPQEYGFYANVNPNVDHPRWSQATERRITGGFSLFNSRIKTQMFNGYEDYVADMYQGMDLTKYY
ncbi:protein-methionine-sulfoxide reductase catalytic subunit MsrP [Marinicella sp. S1101]|uniref:protein-methionine-sulfoxide reductase catalytic subunit MsrP n=1 Tax=Marinicella marina TaxID=2996016 RepID=UPI002260A564|nr:protein-methionine-sulfoxide reductase catalytic subunit MsrP [Marinicella marina]MCX7553446.1 protein-methionine-sulfoxide reductase catalytic subunit MsrP [Marinicella marina]MDJ1140070.1 protein-methionine-sulfoxide reductase catalytic subunit MsrP [Marinicella marina]